jgi:hypothetical protein
LLGSTPPDFVLYGGTALALRLGHRQSVNFDFFSSRKFQPMSLARSAPYLNGQTITQQAADTLSCEVLTAAGPVKISFLADFLWDKSKRQISSSPTELRLLLLRIYSA